MKRTKKKKTTTDLGGFSSGASLGGKEGYSSVPERSGSHPQLLRSWGSVISLASFAWQAIPFGCPRPWR